LRPSTAALFVANYKRFLSFPIGKDDTRDIREYLSCITEAIQEKVAVVLASANFVALLSDSSQTRKTGSEKEMVMVRVERNGKFFFLETCFSRLWRGRRDFLEMGEENNLDSCFMKLSYRIVILKQINFRINLISQMMIFRF